MANHKSALKRARQSKVRQDRNRQVRSAMRTSIKRARAAIEAGDKADAQTQIRATEAAVRRAASKGVIPKRRASRTISRLARSAAAL